MSVVPILRGKLQHTTHSSGAHGCILIKGLLSKTKPHAFVFATFQSEQYSTLRSSGSSLVSRCMTGWRSCENKQLSLRMRGRGHRAILFHLFGQSRGPADRSSHLCSVSCETAAPCSYLDGTVSSYFDACPRGRGRESITRPSSQKIAIASLLLYRDLVVRW